MLQNSVCKVTIQPVLNLSFFHKSTTGLLTNRLKYLQIWLRIRWVIKIWSSKIWLPEESNLHGSKNNLPKHNSPGSDTPAKQSPGSDTLMSHESWDNFLSHENSWKGAEEFDGLFSKNVLFFNQYAGLGYAQNNLNILQTGRVQRVQTGTGVGGLKKTRKNWASLMW